MLGLAVSDTQAMTEQLRRGLVAKASAPGREDKPPILGLIQRMLFRSRREPNCCPPCSSDAETVIR